MKKPLRVLNVEDSEDDALLLVRELKRGGYDPTFERVETAEGMKAALSTQAWDLVLADYSMPHFSGLEALKLFKESGLDLPFIIVSGTIGEDVAVEAMKSGAHDYLMKNNLTRLIPAIQQELRETEVRRKFAESEKALQESEKRYRQVVESATEIIYTVDENGNFTYGNPAGLKATGYSLEELRKLNYADLVVPEHRERVSQIYISQFRERRPTTYVEFPFFSKAGKIIWFGQNTSLVIEDGKVVGFHIIARDITEGKQAEERLQERERYFRTLMYTLHEDIVVIDCDYRITDVNNTFLITTGSSREKVIGKHCYEISHGYAEPCDRHGEQCLLGEVFETGKSRNCKHVHIRGDGSKVHVDILLSPLKDNSGSVTHVVEAIRDVTDLIQAYEALQESEEKYRLLVENANEAIFVIQDGMLRFFNIKNIELIGYSKEELTSTPFINLVHPDDREVTLGRYLKRIRGEELPGVNVFRIIDKAGNIKWVEINSVLISWEGRPATLNFLNDITERKRMEDALRESEEKYRTILEAIEEGYYEVDIAGNFTFFNDSLCRMLGYTRDELMGMNNRQYMDKETVQKVYQVFNRLYTTGGLYEAFDWEIIRKDDTKRFHESSVSLIRDPRGGKIGFRGIARDITERRQAEKGLRESEKKFRELFDNAPVGYFEYDTQGRITNVNRTELEILGYTFEEMIGQPVWKFIVEEEIARQQILAKLAGTMPPARGLERTYRRKDGTTFPAIVEDRLILDSEGKIKGIRATIQDITDRKRAEEALRESEKKYRTLVTQSPDGIFIVDLQGTFLAVNKAMYERLKYSEEEFLSMKIWDIVPEKYVDLHKKRLADILRGETPNEAAEYVVRGKDGKVHYIEVLSNPYFRENEVIGFQGIAHDITERKRAEEALSESERRYRLLAENLTDIIWTSDLNLRLTYVSPSVKRIRGYSVGETLTQTLEEILTPASLEVARKVLTEEMEIENLERKDLFRVRTIELEENCKDGSTVWTESTITFLRDSEGRALGILGVTRDISDRKKAEQEMMVLQEQLRQSQKMEAIGRLAGGIAHDFNNLLTIIKGYSQLSSIELKGDDPLRGNIEEITKASDRASDLIRQLLAFSRRQLLEMRVLDLNAILQGVDKMLRRVIGEDIELVTQLEEDLGTVKTDPGQIEQVIMNLSVNARDAMPNGGKLTIETANADLDQAYARAHVAVTPGRYVMLSVSDTGLGMSPEVRDRVFEPFFTTKEKGKGTGLGLSTVYGIVKQSGGNIWVYSEPGKGTTFKIYLPRVDEPLEEEKKKVEKGEVPRGDETILVVEDEAEVRKVAVRMLTGQGYKVLEAPEGVDAFRICKEHDGIIHLLLTDVVMPKMGGRKLVESLAPFRPGIKVLYMSGYTDNSIVRHGVLTEDMNYVQKPFTLEGLARKVREVLDK